MATMSLSMQQKASYEPFEWDAEKESERGRPPMSTAQTRERKSKVNVHRMQRRTFRRY